MKVLVTGAGGYIGCVVVERLLAAGHTPIALDSFKYGEQEPLRSMKVDRYRVDLYNLVTLGEIPTPDVVIHLAAESAIPLSMTDPGIFYRVNVNGGLNLLDAMRNRGVKNFVFSSTSSVYSPTAKQPLTEDSELGPSSPYGDSKLAFEKLLTWYSRIHDFNAIIFRFFNVSGATKINGERPYHCTRLTSQALNVAKGISKNLDLYGMDYPTSDGTCIRDYIHVQDVADAHVLAIEKLGSYSTSKFFNLGIGKCFSNLEVIQTCREVTGHPIPIIECPRREGDPAMLTCNPTEANQELDWHPKYTDLKSIVETAWEWQKNT